MSFTFVYATGQAWQVLELTQLQSNAAALGIKLNLKPGTFNTVVGAYSGQL